MDKVFLTILNMSLTGAFVIVVICLARVLLKKAPKSISYCLWAAAGFRLVFPFSIESIFSLIPFNARTIPLDIATQHIAQVDSGAANNLVSGALPAAVAQNSVSSLQILTAAGSYLWLLGVAAMLIYGVSSYLLVKRRMKEAVCVDANIFQAENIKSPFVFGIVTPNIYIPAGLSLKEREHIILHERTHIRRHDQLIKFAAYFALCLHWFNPLVWAAFLLMGVDMEMSCDECVLKGMGGEIKKDYSMSLLSLATDRRVIGGSPLAFGEDGVKKRIKNVITYRKPSRVMVVLSVAFVAVLSLGLVGSRAISGDSYETPATESVVKESGVAESGAAESGGVNEYASGYIVSGIGSTGSESTGSDSTGSGGDAKSGRIYIIADYYNEDGKFSGAGLALAEGTSEKVLTVSGGDILVAGDRQYEVTTQSLTLSFYTQPSPGQAVRWWTDYLNSWAQSGKVTLMG